MQSIIECIDEFYSENLGEEVTRGMRESATRGFYLSCRAPYGLRKVRVSDAGRERTRLEIDEDRSRIVKSNFERTTDGEGLTGIVKDLDARGIEGPTGKGWTKTGLYAVLGNEIYTGTVVWGRNSKLGLPPIRVENACPAIVTRELFDRAQAALKQRAFARVHPRRVSSEYLLSGVARCSYCGKAFIGMPAKGGDFNYYVCGTLHKKGAGSCRSRYLNASKLETLVINQIRERILTPANLSELARQVALQMSNNSEEQAQELKSIDGEIADVRRRLDRLYEAIESGGVVLKDLGPRIHELTERREKLEARKGELEMQVAANKVEVPSAAEVRQCAAELRGVLERGSLTEKRAFIRSFVKEVRITGDEVKIIHTEPPSTAGQQEGRLESSSIVRYGGRYKI